MSKFISKTSIQPVSEYDSGQAIIIGKMDAKLEGNYGLALPTFSKIAGHLTGKARIIWDSSFSGRWRGVMNRSFQKIEPECGQTIKGYVINHKIGEAVDKEKGNAAYIVQV